MTRAPASRPGASTPCRMRRGRTRKPISSAPRRPGKANGGSAAVAAPSGTPWPMTRRSICSISAWATAPPGTRPIARPAAATISISRRSSRSARRPAPMSGISRKCPARPWDYTASQTIILADIAIDGKLRKVLLHAPKNGFFYVIDRTNGQFISGRNFVPVNWATGLDPKTGPPHRKSRCPLRQDRQALHGHAEFAGRAQLAAHGL